MSQRPNLSRLLHRLPKNQRKTAAPEEESRHPNRHHTRRVIFVSAGLLILGHALTFLPALIIIWFPHWSKEEKDWFWSPWFKMEIARFWYLKNVADYLLSIITFVVMTKIANQFSTVLFLICFIFLGYHVIDFFMFWWDFNGNFYIYLDVFWTALLLIKYSLFPFKEETLGKIRSLF